MLMSRQSRLDAFHQVLMESRLRPPLRDDQL